MTKENRKNLRNKIVTALNAMVSDLDERESVVEVGGHTLSRRLVFAGMSQWCGCGRDWDQSANDWAWIVDGEYQLSFPDLDYFDGHNMIERQTDYYLQSGYAADPPSEPDGDPLTRVPNAMLIEIGRGLVEAQTREAKRAADEDAAATAIAAQL